MCINHCRFASHRLNFALKQVCRNDELLVRSGRVDADKVRRVGNWNWFITLLTVFALFRSLCGRINQNFWTFHLFFCLLLINRLFSLSVRISLAKLVLSNLKHWLLVIETLILWVRKLALLLYFSSLYTF